MRHVSANIGDHDFMVYLERSANKWPFMPENFSFFIIDSKGKPEFYRLKRDFINLGGDYSLIDLAAILVALALVPEFEIDAHTRPGWQMPE